MASCSTSHLHSTLLHLPQCFSIMSQFTLGVSQTYNYANRLADAAGVIVQPARGLLLSTKLSSGGAKRKPVGTHAKLCLCAVAQLAACSQPGCRVQMSCT